MDDSLICFLHSLETSLLNNDHPINLDKSKQNIETLENSTISKTLELILDHLFDQNYSKVLDVDLSDIGICFDDDEERFFYCPIPNSENDTAESKMASQFILLFIGLSALNEFVRMNICGPSSEEKETLQTTIFNHEPFQLFSSLDFTKNYLRKCAYGEFPTENTLFPNLLCVSYVCFQCMDLNVDPTNTRRWWMWRCKIIHQRILYEKIASLYEEMDSLSKELIEMDWIKKEKSLLLLAYVEIEQMYLLHDRVRLAEAALESAQNLTDLSIELSGAYGRRTHFQQKLVPQLFVKVQRKENEETDSLNKSSDESNLEMLLSRVKLEDMPPDLQLQDDTLLNNVVFTSGDPKVRCIPELTPQEELVLVGKCFLLNKTSVSDDLKLDEISPFIQAILSIPHSSWAVRYSTLALRCRLENKSSRRADRALRQLDSLLACTRKSDPPFHVRSYSLYAAATPLKSDVEGYLADLLMSVGAIKSALEVFQRLGRWEAVVNCLRQLGRTKEAVEILKERLASEATPMLYCLLGDVLDDPEMYVKAVKLMVESNIPDARCSRSMGFWLYKRKEYAECITFFQASVLINYLQPQVWFALGYAALQVEKYSLAAKAYRQVVSLEADDFQAWNNLSHAYIRSKQKYRAWSSLKEAIKCNYEEWRVWENFLLVSVDIGAFDDAIRAYHRLLDIKDNKHVDIQVLEILVKAVIVDVEDVMGSPASRFKQKLKELFGRLTSVVKKNGEVWKLYSKLIWPDLGQYVDKDSMMSACLYQQQALVCCTSINTWPSEFNSFKNILEMCIRNTKMFIVYYAASEDLEAKTKVKLSTKGIISRSEQGLINFQDKEKMELGELLNSVITAYDELINV